MTIDVGKDSDQTTLHLSQVMKNHSQTTIADKLHHHFAHALADILIRLIKTVGSPWTNDPDLKGQLKSAMRNCQRLANYSKCFQQSLLLGYLWQLIFKKQLPRNFNFIVVRSFCMSLIMQPGYQQQCKYHVNTPNQ